MQLPCTYTIRQILPAEGWYAVYDENPRRQPHIEAPNFHLPLICWALISYETAADPAILILPITSLATPTRGAKQAGAMWQVPDWLTRSGDDGRAVTHGLSKMRIPDTCSRALLEHQQPDRRSIAPTPGDMDDRVADRTHHALYPFIQNQLCSPIPFPTRTATYVPVSQHACRPRRCRRKHASVLRHSSRASRIRTLHTKHCSTGRRRRASSRAW